MSRRTSNPAATNSFYYQINDNTFHQSRMNHCLRPRATPLYRYSLTRKLYGSNIQTVPDNHVRTCSNSFCNPAFGAKIVSQSDIMYSTIN